MIASIKKDAITRMEKCIEIFKNQITKVHTGRPVPGLLNGILVEYYGALVSLYKLSKIVLEDQHTLKISLFDQTIKSVVEKAIMNSNLGFCPRSVGGDIYIAVPPLTEERRRSLIKMIRAEAEQSRIAVRSIRRDANDKLRILLRDKLISKDDDHRAQDDIQKLTNVTIDKIDVVLADKEAALIKF